MPFFGDESGHVDVVDDQIPYSSFMNCFPFLYPGRRRTMLADIITAYQRYIDNNVRRTDFITAPNNLEFKKDDICPISLTPLKHKLIGCSHCKTLYNDDPFMKWYKQSHICPVCRNSNSFYKVSR